MIKKKKFTTPLYGTKFTVVMSDSFEELAKEFDNSEASPVIGRTDGFVFTHKDHLYIVFYCGDEGYPTPSLIAHEANHLKNNIFIEVYHELDRYNDEPESYLMGWIVETIHNFKDKFNG